mmetsp:Transcript_16284/g.18759  ORF Transcript_16284/g.18759 Transcript_16284/m.18759 type:complete len:127 (+) Transcript_16284:130-510(+)|eukprot:CAMPEP_0194442518 /NCGR_PEP_ID=MMETSP0176-20130528/126174_1 /TAXON_ID=216777 /ORGANISM="Proboscia alata, Strain PI-D3" /LENGTH=126 /DNA_ID=CAMNT_0039268623 /DNA_START=120 /DNA_END=500 /DNA_ORIENTATION=-
MTSNEVPIAVRDLVESIISSVENRKSNIGNIDDGISPLDAAPRISPNRTVVDEALNIDDGISPLAVTPRVSLNRSPPQQRTSLHNVESVNDMFFDFRCSFQSVGFIVPLSGSTNTFFKRNARLISQ